MEISDIAAYRRRYYLLKKDRDLQEIDPTDFNWR